MPAPPSTPATSVHDTFLTWAHANGIQTNSLRITSTKFAGTGITAAGPIKKGTLIALTPPSLLLSLTHLPPDLSPKKHPKLRTHALLTTFLLRELRDPASKWRPWINVWPSAEDMSRDMPILWDPSPQEEALLPDGVRALLTAQRARLEQDWKDVVSAGLTTPADRDQWTYTWTIVNTRTLFYRPAGNPLYKSLPAADCLTLCPFIDYFNHSVHAEHACAVELTPRGYEVRAGRDYVEGEEVCVSYGPHGGDELLVEYGFSVGGNPYDSVALDRYVEEYLSEQGSGGGAGVYKRVLHAAGFWGGYRLSLDAPTGCFRTQVAVRLGLLDEGEVRRDEGEVFPSGPGMRRWRAFVEGRDGGEREKGRVEEIVRGWLEDLERRRVKGMEGLRGEEKWKGMVRERWGEIAEIAWEVNGKEGRG